MLIMRMKWFIVLKKSYFSFSFNSFHVGGIVHAYGGGCYRNLQQKPGIIKEQTQSRMSLVDILSEGFTTILHSWVEHTRSEKEVNCYKNNIVFVLYHIHAP